MNSIVLIAIFIIVLFILFGIAISWFDRNRKKKENKKLLKEFENFVIKNRLTIDKKQKLHKNMIGLDRLNLKLVFLDNNKIPQRFYIINLEELSACSLIKQKNFSNGYISKIYLQCILKKKKIPEINIPFYSEVNDDVFKMLRLSKKAAYWEKSINIFRETAILMEQNS